MTERKKHVLIVGKTSRERKTFLNDLISRANKTVYRFPADLKTFDEYIDQVRKIFPFVPVNWKEQNPKKWTKNQVWDFHLDWTKNTTGIMVILEEFGEMDPNWRFEIIRDYLQQSYYQEELKNNSLNFQLIVTQERADHMVQALASIFGIREDERRTVEEVILGKLEIIDLDLT